MNEDSVRELRRELQSVEDSIFASESELQRRRQNERAAAADGAAVRRSLDGNTSSKDAAHREMRRSGRQKQVLDAEQKRRTDSPTDRKTREEYIGLLVEGEERRDALQGDIDGLKSQVGDLNEKRSDAQKRLTVVRLISMLDSLQNALDEKVNAPGSEDEEAHAQELLKSLQELSRERERSLTLLTKKEHEMSKSIELKQKRIAELRLESDRNMNTVRDGNEKEVYGVMDRIIKERRTLMADINRLEETNNQMSRVIIDTKYTANGAVSDRRAALGIDDTMRTSHDPEEEKLRLRHRIVAANAEKRQFELRTEELQRRAEEDSESYNVKMSRMLREILVYEEENTRVKKGNVSLKALCDSIAASLQA